MSHRSLQVETPEEVAEDIRYALNYVDPEKLVLTSDCGFGRGGPNRLVAFYKATAIAQGANIVDESPRARPRPRMTRRRPRRAADSPQLPQVATHSRAVLARVAALARS